MAGFLPTTWVARSQDRATPFGGAKIMRRRDVFPAPARLAELFAYEPDAGRLILRIAQRGKPVGSEAGRSTPLMYRVVFIDGVVYFEHLVIWTLLHGALPKGKFIDHRDLDKANNRASNLRLATRSQNGANRRVQRDNQLRIKGVDLHAATGKYRAQIKHSGRKIHLGLFDNPLSAHEAYVTAALRYHGDFARGA